MGRKKKGFNWKARQAVETIIDKSEQNKVNDLSFFFNILFSIAKHCVLNISNFMFY